MPGVGLNDPTYVVFNQKVLTFLEVQDLGQNANGNEQVYLHPTSWREFVKLALSLSLAR